MTDRRPDGYGRDARQYSPSAARNRGLILDVLRRVAPPRGHALEVASGSGEHVVHFARGLCDVAWLPSDPDAAARASIAAWIAAAGATNVRTPIALDACAAVWGVEAEAPFDLVLAVNMVHITPWEATAGLLAGAGRVLGPGGLLFLYGPFRRGGRHTAPSNAAFDAELGSEDPRWGIRDVDDLAREGAAHRLAYPEVVEMPANNLSLIFRKTT